MTAKLLSKLLLLLTLTCYCLPSLALDPKLNWRSLRSEHFIVHFPQSHTQTAQRISHLAEQIHHRLSPQLAWQPDQPTHLVLNDFSDTANGSATVVPYNLISLNLSPPPSGSELSDFNDWMENLLVHEYSHILQLDKKRGVPDLLRRYLGHQVFFYPNLYQPNWLIEGLATHMETDDQKEIGRRQSSLYLTMMQTELTTPETKGSQANRNRTKPPFKSLSQINAHQVEWPLNTDYLYGAFFYKFLQQRYGEQSIFNFVSAYSNNWLPFALNTTSKEIFNQSFAALWQEFEIWLLPYLATASQNPNPRKTQAPENTALKGQIANPSINRLSHHGGFTGPVRTEEDQVFYLRNDGHQQAAIMQWQNSAPPKQLMKVEPGSRFDFHPKAGFVVAQLDYCDSHRLFYDLYLFQQSSFHAEKNGQRITHCGRYHDVAWHPNGETIAAITTRNGHSEIHLLNSSGELAQSIPPPSDARILSAIDWSKDGQFLVSSSHNLKLGQWDIAEYSLKSRQWQWITHDRAIDSQPQYSPSDEAIVFSSDQQTTTQAYQYNRQSKLIQTLSSHPTGAFSPNRTNNDQVVYIGYHQDGFDVYRQPPSSQKVMDGPKRKVKGEPTNIPTASNQNIESTALETTVLETTALETTPTVSTDYSPLPTLLKTTWLPIFSYHSDRGTRLGASFSGSDPLRFHKYQWGGFLDTFANEPSGFLNYQYNDRVFVAIDRSNRYYVDSSNSLTAQETKDSAEFFYHIPWLKRARQWHLLTGFAVENHRFKNINLPFSINPTAQDFVLGAALFFNSSQRYVYNTSRTEGRQIYAAIEWTQESNSKYSGASAIVDWRKYLPLNQRHVIALRQVLAATEESALPFKLGDTFGDNYLSLRNVFNRREFSLRGYENNNANLQGKFLSLSSIEWRFPLFNVERTLMIPPLGLGQIHGSLFIDSGNAWSDSQLSTSPDSKSTLSINDWHSSIGAELIVHPKLFYRVDLIGRLGAVRALNDLKEDTLYASLGLSF